VTCTATDSSGNVAIANLTVVVVGPLDIALTVDRHGAVDKQTGLVVIAGTITCNREVSVFLNGELTQTVGRDTILRGLFATSINCSGGGGAWTATVQENGGGRFRAGAAHADVFSSSCDSLSSCDFDQVGRRLTLVPRRL
jgi:hypothetical protein